MLIRWSNRKNIWMSNLTKRQKFDQSEGRKKSELLFAAKKLAHQSYSSLNLIKKRDETQKCSALFWETGEVRLLVWRESSTQNASLPRVPEIFWKFNTFPAFERFTKTETEAFDNCFRAVSVYSLQLPSPCVCVWVVCPNPPNCPSLSWVVSCVPNSNNSQTQN